jgi:hypothetical protein
MSIAEPTLCAAEKRCSKCQQFFPATLDYFVSDNRTPTKLGYTCRLCVNARRNQRRSENPEHYREIKHLWSLKNPDKVYAQSQKAYKKHRDKIRRRNALYKQTKPEVQRASNTRRRARKAHAPRNDLTAQQWQTILAAFHYRCAYCPSTCSWCQRKKHKLTQDHVTPYKHNGSNTLWNVVPACATCNLKKYIGPPLRPVQPLLL